MSKCAIIGAECPRTNSPDAKRYCPAWNDGVVWENAETGSQKVVNCSFAMLMPGLIEVIKASNRPAAAIESTRNEISKGLHNIAKAMQAIPTRQVKELPDHVKTRE